MASSINKSLCMKCEKKEAFFTCCTCRLDYCEDHINEHEQTSIKQIDHLLNDHQQLQQMIVNYIQKPNQHPLIQQIDQWERQSINKIQQTANDARKQILNVLNDHIISIKKSLENLTKTLENLRNDEKLTESFVLQEQNTLEKLKNDLITPETIRIRKDDDNITFISKLLVLIVEPEDLFEKASGNIRVEDNGQTIIHGQWSDHASVRGKNQYSSGQHRLTFKIEELDPDKWAFFGIVSKSAPIRSISISTPTAYGLAGQNGICINGIYDNTGQQTYESDMEINDILELLIDCDHKLIRLTNQRTHYSYTLQIDTEKCPFPWQILVGLCCSAGDCIRILPCTYKE